jgi:hypothetical protein
VLTDEERKRIYEEEKARLEAREKLKRESPGGVWYAFPIALVVMLLLALLFVICRIPGPITY